MFPFSLQQTKLQRLRAEGLRLIRALKVHGCDLEAIKKDAIEFELQVSLLEGTHNDLTDAVYTVYQKLYKKEEARRRLSGKTKH